MAHDSVELATELTIAWLSNPSTRASAGDVPAFLASMHQAVSQLSKPDVPAAVAEDEARHAPAVSVRKSLASPDHIISMIDGKAYRTLKRHLSRHGLTPDAYRERYGLKPDYPMVAPSYSAARTAMAKQIGLGRKKAAVDSPAATEAKASKGGRKGKSFADAMRSARAHLTGDTGSE